MSAEQEPKRRGKPLGWRKPETPDPEAGAYSVTEAAKVLGIGRVSVYTAIQNGTLPSIRVGKRVVISKQILGRILEKGTLEGITEAGGTPDE